MFRPYYLATGQLDPHSPVIFYNDFLDVTVDMYVPTEFFHSSNERIGNRTTPSFWKIESDAWPIPVGQHVGHDSIHSTCRRQTLKEKTQHIQPVFHEFIFNLHFLHDIGKGFVEGLPLFERIEQCLGVLE